LHADRPVSELELLADALERLPEVLAVRVRIDERALAALAAEQVVERR
jgi:hypothetical protein